LAGVEQVVVVGEAEAVVSVVAERPARNHHQLVMTTAAHAQPLWPNAPFDPAEVVLCVLRDRQAHGSDSARAGVVEADLE
jgi:hypothetical protein